MRRRVRSARFLSVYALLPAAAFVAVVVIDKAAVVVVVIALKSC